MAFYEKSFHHEKQKTLVKFTFLEVGRVQTYICKLKADSTRREKFLEIFLYEKSP
jgi:hypothetical protein